MVYDYTITDSTGRAIRIGQIHVDQSPFDETADMAAALLKLGTWIKEHPHLIARVPAGVEIKIARV